MLLMLYYFIVVMYCVLLYVYLYNWDLYNYLGQEDTPGK